ncbi:MAG: glycosyltransferase family 4 protein [Bacteroidia bacterium]|nr:glycosyltransferase family 4 protein [Bacteroidia bacterium]
MKKILFMGGLQSGGAEHQMVIVAAGLAKRGYDVSYLCSGDDDFFKPVLEDAKVKIIQIKENRLTSLLKLNIPRLSFCVYRILKKERFDTVVSFLGLWNYENCRFAKCKKKKHRANTGLMNKPDIVWLSKKDRFYTKYEKYADVKVCNSDNAKNKFSKYFPEHKDKLITIYNAVALPPINSSYNVKNGERVNIIIPASYRDVKNPFGLLNALNLLDEYSKSRLHITWYGNINGGKAVYEQMLEQIAAQHLGDVIELKDATTDIANRIYENDMVGLFSKSEGLPNAICEGMLLGKSIIMTRVSDFDVLVDASNGILCDWDNPESIADALRNVAKLSNEELVEMGNNSKRKAEKLFAEDGIINQWEQII